MIKNALIGVACGVFIVLFTGLMIFSIKRDARNQAIHNGRADRENGHPMQSNPYVEPTYREYWRQGWREAQEIRE